MKKIRHLITLTFAVALTSALALAQEQKNELKIVSAELRGVTFDHVSSNGKYAVGYVPENAGYVYEIATGKITVIEGPKGAVLYNVSTRQCTAEDISNDGVVSGSFLDPDAIISYLDEKGNPLLDKDGNPLRSSVMVPGVYKDGVWKALERHDDQVALVGGLCDGAATCITADGTKIAGMVHIKLDPPAEFGMRFAAALWNVEDGKIIREYDGCTEMQGGRVWNVSDDASLLGGWTESGGRGPAVWSNGEYIRISNYGTTTAVSPNGKYAAGDSEGLPFIWTKEKGVVTCPIHEGLFGGAISGISNDGTAVGYSYTQGFPQSRFPFVIDKNGVFYDIVDYLKVYYDYTIPEELMPEALRELEVSESEYLNTAMDISADGSVICGWTAFREPWVITLEVSTNIKSIENSSNDIQLIVSDGNARITSSQPLENIAILNYAGQVMVNKAVNGNGYAIGSLADGIYLMQTTASNGNVITKKFIIK